MRKSIIAGNWKMYKTAQESLEFCEVFKNLVVGSTHCEIVLCPPFTSLEALSSALQGSDIELGAQNMHWGNEGAYTGEISPVMLKALGCKYVILGHSERREYFHESDELINRKLRSALEHVLIPILCVGERLEQREAGTTYEVLKAQLIGGLKGLSAEETANIIIAYEPVWAIGTGKTASSSDAEEVIAYIRRTIEEKFGPTAATAVRIQYGGSVKPNNATELMSMPNIDGALVGGAALDPATFAQIVNWGK